MKKQTGKNNSNLTQPNIKLRHLLIRKLKMYRMKAALILLFLLIAFSCDDLENAILEYNTEIISISYGTSFGECTGYCTQSINIEGTSVEYTAKGFLEEEDLPEINREGEITQEEWESLIKNVNFIVFRNLEEVIGCPDCNDGGAEWVEIETSNLTHKVTFEYGNAPDEIQNYIEELKSILLTYSESIN